MDVRKADVKGEKNMENIYFDYEKKVWVVNGLVQDCGHVTCNCVQRIYAGKPIENLYKGEK